MRGNPTTPEKRATIVELYDIGYKRADIAKQVGKCVQTISNVLEAEGIIEVNHYSRPRKATTKETICPKCKAKGHIKGSRYCYKCGTDIRSEAVIIAEKLQSLLPNVQLLPDSIRSEASDIIQQAVKYLHNQGV